jgi:hypothetical protein
MDQTFNEILVNRDNSRDNASPLPIVGDHFGDHFIFVLPMFIRGPRP